MSTSIKILVITVLTLLINACSSNLNWREVYHDKPSFTILFPAKPISHTRKIKFEGIELDLTMMAADVDGLNFAIAFGKPNNKNNLDKELLNLKLLNLMQKGMLNNIQGKVVNSDIENTIAVKGQLKNKEQVKMYAQFLSKKDWLIQIVVIGNEKKLTKETLEMYFGSLQFK